MSNFSNSEKKRHFAVFCLLGVGTIALCGFGALMLFAPEKTVSNAHITKSKADAIQGGAGAISSIEYNKKLEAHDAQKANAALQAGNSYIPTPVGQSKPALQKKDEKASAPPPVLPVHTAPVRTVQTVRTPVANNAMQKRMMEDLALLDSRLSSSSATIGRIAYLRDFENVALPSHEIQSTLQENTPSIKESVNIQIGDILYAVVETGVNSDVPSAIMATVVSGKYKNTKLLGRFQRFEERLVLTFTRAVLPSGKSVQFEAYAIDPSTTEASVASSVDTHFFTRWGGLVASAFLEGLATAKRFSGAQSTVYGGSFVEQSSDQMLWNTYDTEEQAWIAAGKVGEKSSKIFEKQFDRPPTVYLDSGTPIGVLILNVKE